LYKCLHNASEMMNPNVNRIYTPPIDRLLKGMSKNKSSSPDVADDKFRNHIEQLANPGCSFAVPNVRPDKEWLQSSIVVGSDQIAEIPGCQQDVYNDTTPSASACIAESDVDASEREREKERKEKVRRLQSCKRWRVVVVEAASGS